MAEEIIIHDGNYTDFIDCEVNGEKKHRGLKPRNYAIHPVGCFAFAPRFSLDIIPESQWQSRLDELIARKAQLSDIRNTGMNGSRIPSRDQNGRGYCWGHSSTSVAMIWRALMGLPYADLSAYAVCCIIKRFRDEGGNAIDSLSFMADRGIPTSQYWPQQSTNRSNDNPQTWANAALHKFAPNWMDLDTDQDQMRAQLVTCLLLGIPVATDFDWWGHSVASIDLVSVRPFRTRIWNSWGDDWSDNGMGLLEGSKAIPNGAVAALTMSASYN